MTKAPPTVRLAVQRRWTPEHTVSVHAGFGRQCLYTRGSIYLECLSHSPPALKPSSGIATVVNCSGKAVGNGKTILL